MKNFNLIAKVEEANSILHLNKDDIRHVDRLRALIRDWVKALQELIDNAREV
jgi:hypothetical protein